MESIYGIEFDPLPERSTPTDLLLIVKALDEDGEFTFYTRASESLSTWEAIGLLTATLDQLRKALSASFIDEDETD